MSANRYRFRSVWSIRAAADDVFAALVDVECYPRWWTDIRSVRRLDADTGTVHCRSVLPYGLRLHLRRVDEDGTAGRLAVAISGDLVGYCDATVRHYGPWTVVRIDQDVEMTRPLLRRAAGFLRPVLRANHHAMMWRGQRGLRAYLHA